MLKVPLHIKVFRKSKNGFSLLEVLLASSLLLLSVSAIVGAIVYGTQSQASTGYRNRALNLANECLEASRNIRDANYASLVPGTYGLSLVNNKWQFSGSSDSTDTIFNRQVSVSAIAPNLSQVVCTVLWNPANQLSGQVSLSTYLSNWRAETGPVLTPKKRGLILYGNSTTNRPIAREYDDTANTFLASENLPIGSSPTSMDVKTSPTKGEAVLTYVNSSGLLRTMCYDDSTDVWTEDWSVSVGGNGDIQRYAVSYETTSGDVIVFYTTNNSNTNEIAYRTKPGSLSCGSANWSVATNYDTQRTSGQVRWLKTQRDPRAGQDRIFVAWSDTNNDLSAGIWTGSTMGSEPSAAFELNLEYHLAVQDMRSWDLAVESITGNAMIVWSPFGSTCTAGSTSLTASCMRWSRYTTSWSTPVTIPTVADRGTDLSIAANPTSNEIVLGAIANDSNDLSLAYWSGSAWTGRANHDTTCAATSQYGRIVGTGWLNSGSTKRSVIAYSDSNSNNIDWVVGNNATFTTQADFTTSPPMGTLQNWIDLEQNPENLDYLYYLVADKNNRLWVKRLYMTSAAAFTWTNSDTPGPIEGSLSANIGHPFAFAFWKVVPLASAIGLPDYSQNSSLAYLFFKSNKFYLSQNINYARLKKWIRV